MYFLSLHIPLQYFFEIKWIYLVDVASLWARCLGCCQCSIRIHFVVYLTVIMHKFWLVCQFLSLTSKENSNNKLPADKYLHFENDRAALQQIKNKHFLTFSILDEHALNGVWIITAHYCLQSFFIAAFQRFTNFWTKGLLHRCPIILTFHITSSQYHLSQD